MLDWLNNELLVTQKPRPSRGFFYLRPMQRITFYGWQVGMQKIPFSHLLRDEVGLSLKEAQACMLLVLDEQPVTLHVPDALAARLLTQAKALGVRCRLEPPLIP